MASVTPDNKKKNCPKQKECSPLSTFYFIFHVIIAMFAFYLSFKCNKGFDFVGFLGACYCPVLYIPYKLGTVGMCSK